LTLQLLHGAWVIVGVLAVCATLPGTVELLLLSIASLLPARPEGEPARAAGWRAAVVVPAHNEEANIASCVRSLLAADRGDMQVDVYVVADNCTDGTARAASEAGAFVLSRTNHEERGKGYALHFAFTTLQPLGYDGVLVVDADTIVAANFIVAAGGALRDGADAIQVRYLVRNLNEGVRTRLMGLALRAWNVLRPLGRERLGLSVGLLGNGFGLRSETLRVVPYLASSVVEDLEYHLALVQSGYRVKFVNETAVFGEVPVRSEGVRSQRSRWEGGRFRMIHLMGPKLLRGVLRGQLIFLEPLFELLLLPLAFHVTLLAIAVLTPLPLVRDLGLAGMAVVLLHLTAAILVGGGSWRDAGTLAIAPLYVLWKLMLIPSLLRNARVDQTWVRTKRNAEAELAEDPASAAGRR
jgi:cellulose synthase/poly-beta-1,6-N-acetylglucosamine synthase-like glycosyltransferase